MRALPALSGPLQAILWMLLSTLCFVSVTSVVRFLGTDLPAAQTSFLRFAFGAVFLAPSLWGLLQAGVPRAMLRLHLGRGVVHVAAVICWFYAMARIPMAEVTAIGYLNPVLLTLGTALFFGERLTARRIGAIGIALLGAVIVLRPGLREVTQGHLSQVCAAVFFAGSYLFAKRLSTLASAAQIVAMLSLIVTVMLAPFAAVVWVPITLAQMAWVALLAVFATGGHYAMSRAFAAAPIAVSQPVVFLQLVWAAALGFVLFGEQVDPMVILGGAVIVGAVSYNTIVEARRRPPQGNAGPQ